MNGDGSAVHQLTHHPAEDESPALSNDCTRLAFASNRDGDWDIYLLDLTKILERGSSSEKIEVQPEQLTNKESDENSPSWSPDNTQITFVSGEMNHAEIYLVDLDQLEVGDWQQLTDNSAEDRLPRWSPDGTKIVFQSSQDGNPEIYTIRPDGSGSRRLTDNVFTDYDPSWSSDGRQITFISMREDDPDFEIYHMNADGSSQEPLVQMIGTEHLPIWSPDGSRIAFLSNRSGEFEIYTAHPDGSERQRLTFQKGWDVLHSWEFSSGSFSEYRDHTPGVFVNSNWLLMVLNLIVR